MINRILLFLLLLTAGSAWAQTPTRLIYSQQSGTSANDQVLTADLNGTFPLTGTARLSNSAQFTQPNDLAFDPVNNYLFVIDNSSNTSILRYNYDRASGALSNRTVVVAGTPSATYQGVALDAANGRLYFTQSSVTTTLDAIKVAEGVNAGTISTAITPTVLTNGDAGNFANLNDIVYDAANRQLYVADAVSAGGSILRYQLNANGISITGSPTSLIGGTGVTGLTYTGLALDVANSRLYFAQSITGSTSTADDAVKYLSTSTFAVTPLVAGNGNNFYAPSDLTIDLTGQYLYVADQGNPGTNSILRFQLDGTAATAQNTLATVIPSSSAGSYSGVALDGGFTSATTVTSITTTTTSPTNAGSITYTVTFAASVTGLTSGNFSLSPTVAGASIGTPTVVSGSNNTQYTVVVSTGSSTSNGTLQLNLANDTGLSTSLSNEPYAGPAITIDKTAPTVTISSTAGSNGGSTATTPIPFTITFSESVTGFVASEVTVGNGTLTGLSGSGTTYTFNVTPTSSGTTVTVNVAANTAQDAAGNGNTAAAQFSIFYQQPLTASSQAVIVNLDANGNGTLAASGVNNGSSGPGTLTYTIQKIAFGYIPESTAPLTLTTPNGANFTQIRFASYGTPNNNSNGNYSLGSCNAANSLAAAQNAYVGRSSGSLYASNTDTRNNPVLGDPCSGTPKALAVQAAYSADAASLTYDCTEAGKTQYVLLTVSSSDGRTSTSVAQVTVNAPPAIAISNVSPNSAQRGAAVTVTGTNLSGVNSVTVNGATATVSSLSATSFTFVVPSGATLGAGNLTVTAPCSQTLTSTFNVTAPALTATVSTNSASPTSTAPIPFSVSFSQSVGSTFTASDVTVLGGTLTSGSFGGSGAGPYTFTVTPTGSSTVTVSLAANVAQDANNTGNTASNAVSVQYNQPVTAAPVVTTPANGSLTNNPQPTYQGTAPANSTVTVYVGPSSGTASAIGTTTASAGGTFSLAQPTALAGGVYQVYATAQTSGSTVSANSNTNSFTVDTTVPTVVLSSTTVANGGTTSTSPVNFTATFSEPVAGFTAAGIAVSGGSVTSGPTAGSGNTYAFQVTLSGAGNVTVQVRANAAQDQAGNSNPASGAYAFTFAAPTIVVAPANSTLPNGTQGTAYSLTFSASGGTAPYTYAITAGAVPSGMSLTSGGTLSGTPTTNGTFNFTVTATDNSAAPGPYSGSRAYSLTIAAPAVTAVTWTGNISTDWFTAGNWSSNTLPSSTISATIPTAPSGGRFPNISAGTANVRNFTLNSGASLNQSGGTLVVAGDLTNNGTFQPTGGTVLLGNTAFSNILGSSNTRFWNLTVGINGAQQSTSASTSVQRLLLLNGNFSTNGNSFTLESNANLTSQVTNNNGVVNGNVTVQRYIDPSLNPNLGYRHVSPAVSGQTVSSLTTSGFSPVVNPAYNTSATPLLVTPFPTVYGYDQSRLATATNNLSTFDKGWVSPNALSDALNVGQGYTALISGGQTWAFTGALNNGTQTLTLARNTGATAADAGLSLVGNPYPSPLDWRQVASNGLSNVDGAIYVFQSNDPTNPYAGQYGVYANNVGTISPILAQGQGFFVRVTAGQTSGTLTFTNAQRPTTYTATTYYRTTAETRPLVQLSLKAAGRATGDDAFVYFEQGSTEGFDSQYDARKLPNPSGLNLSTTVGSEQFSIDGRPAIGTVQRVIPLAVGVPAAGAYSLSSAQLLNLDTTPVYLRDLQAGTLTDLRLTPSYQFTVSNASALITNRFELVFSPQQPLATVPAALAQQVALYPNPAKKAAFVELPASLGRQAVTATLVDALGRQVRTVNLPAKGALAHQLDLSELATGVYALRLSTSAGVVVKKLVIE